MNSKSTKIIYWVTTSLLALFIIPGAFFMNSELAQEGTKHLEIPRWLALEVGIAQPIGALLILLPFIRSRFKEWGYVGLGIVYISAFIGHLYYDGFTAGNTILALVMFALLLVSYFSYHRMRNKARY